MTVKEYFAILIPSLALSIALYTFLSNNPKFREFGKRFGKVVILQLVAVLSCAMLILTSQLKIDLVDSEIAGKIILILENILLYFVIFFFISSWIYLCYIFYKIFGSLYYMRKSRFIKYTSFISWIYEKFFHKKTYEKVYRQRTPLTMNCLPNINLENVNNGGAILLQYDSTFDCVDFIVDYIIETINNEETVDYISTLKQPLEIPQKISGKIADKDLTKITKKLSIIDCFSPYYAFDDKILKIGKEECKEKGFKFYESDSFAAIHTATNDSWYRFREQCKAEENSFRVPHRTIFNTLSSLIRFSSEEQFFLYLRHVLSSEKAYGMITLLIEPKSLKSDIENELIQLVDVVLQINREGITQTK